MYNTYVYPATPYLPACEKCLLVAFSEHSSGYKVVQIPPPPWVGVNTEEKTEHRVTGVGPGHNGKGQQQQR